MSWRIWHPSETRRRPSRAVRRALALAVLLPIAACAACLQDGNSTFPTTASRGGTSAPSETTYAPADNLPKEPIVVASPYTDETVEYLGMLYYSRITGIFPPGGEERIGDSVNLQELAQFRDSFPVESIQTEPGGIGSERLRSWAASGSLPDIFLTDDAARCVTEGWAAELTVRAGSSPLLSMESVYPALAESVKTGGRLFGIPMSFSVPIMYCDTSRIVEYGLEAPSADGWDIAAFLGWAKTVPGTGLDGTPTPGTGVPAGTGSGTAATTETDAVLLSAEGLLEHLPAGMDSSLGWATWNGNGFSFSVPAFLNAATMVEQLAVSGLTADRMATGALPSASGSPAFSGRYLIKIGDSSRLSAERSRLGPALGLARIPFAGTERIGAHVYSLCVRADAAASPGVADFAAFVALDPDARLLASRFYQSEGYLPVLRDQEVWEATAGKADAVRFFLAYRPLLENAYVDGSTCIPGWEAVYTDRFRRVESELLKGTLTAGQAVEALQADS